MCQSFSLWKLWILLWNLFLFCHSSAEVHFQTYKLRNIYWHQCLRRENSLTANDVKEIISWQRTFDKFLLSTAKCLILEDVELQDIMHFYPHWFRYCFLWNCQTKKFGIWKSSKQRLLMSDFTLQSHLSHMVMMNSLLGKDDYGFGWWCSNYWDTLGGTELTRPRLTRGQKTNVDLGKNLLWGTTSYLHW